MRLCSLFSPFDCRLCLNCEAGNHASFFVPNGDFGGPLAADVSVFVVPLVGRRQAGDHVNTDALMGIRGKVLNDLFLVEVADSHVAESRMAPMPSGFDWHRVRQLFQAHSLAVVPSDKVFPVEFVLAGFRVVNDNSGFTTERVREHFRKIPTCVVVVIARNPKQRHFVGVIECPVDGVLKYREAFAEYFGWPVVSGIDDRSLGCGFGGKVVKVQEIIPDRDYNFFDHIRPDLLDHSFDGVLIILRGDLQIVVIRTGLLSPAEFAEVAIIQAEFDQVRSVFALSRSGFWGYRHLGDQILDPLLNGLWCFSSELDGYLPKSGFPKHLVFIASGVLNFSLPCDFPIVDFAFGDLPDVSVDLRVVEQLFNCLDLVPVVG